MTRFSLAAGIAMMAGCATVCETSICRQEQIAKDFVNHPTDVGVRAIGAKTLMRIHPEMAVDSIEVRRALIPLTVQCTVVEVKEMGGVKMASCVMAPSHE